MSNKLSLSILSASFGLLLASPLSFGQTTTPEKTTTTTIEQTTVTPATPAKKVKAKPVVVPAKPAEATTIKTSTTTTEVPAPPQKEVARKVYDEETLKKMSDTLCAQGYKAYVGSDEKNICRGKATPPDIAYTCIWHKKGPGAFSPTTQGPCNLDYVEHKGNIVVLKENYPHDAPMDYGMQAECCYRAAKGMEPAATK